MPLLIVADGRPSTLVATSTSIPGIDMSFCCAPRLRVAAPDTRVPSPCTNAFGGSPPSSLEFCAVPPVDRYLALAALIAALIDRNLALASLIVSNLCLAPACWK